MAIILRYAVSPAILGRGSGLFGAAALFEAASAARRNERARFSPAFAAAAVLPLGSMRVVFVSAFYF